MSESKTLRRCLCVMAGILLLMQAACGSDGVTSPPGVPSPAATPAPTRVTGTWRGGSPNMSLVWQLDQDGDSIAGTSHIAGNGGWTGRGRLTGKVDGSKFVFEETHASGTLSVPDCSATVRGTLEVSTLTTPASPRPGPPISVPTPPPTTRTTMSGHVTGHGCNGDFQTMIYLSRD